MTIFHKKWVFLIIYIFFGNLYTHAQSVNLFFNKNVSNYETDSSVVKVQLTNTNFFRDNEYFNPFYEGYTLPGYFLQPSLVYSPVSKVKILAGVHLQKYSGIQGFSQVLPVFAFSYHFSDKSEFTLGKIDNPLYQDFPEPAYDPEKFLTHNVRNGMSYKYASTRFYSTVWINWKQFIFQGSNYPEKLLFGTTNQLNLSSKLGKHNLQLSFQILISHIGGQIDISETFVESLVNMPVGFTYLNKISKFYTFSFSEKYILFNDISPTKRKPYILGFGNYAKASFSSENLDLTVAHWFGNLYISPAGNPLFESVAEFSDYSQKRRAIISGSFLLKKEITKKIKIGIGADIYFDLYSKILDYSFGVYSYMYLDKILIAK